MNEVFYTPYLMGGLGNQMFQVANTLSQSLSNDISAIFRPVSNTPRQGNQTIKYVDNIFSKLLFSDKIKPLKRISEHNWEYNELILPKDISIEIYGYFQSSKNFAKNKNKIIQSFEPNNEFLTYAYKKYPELLYDNTLSVHVRRGDSFSALEVHPVVTKSYFDRAIKEINNISHIFVFTDDKIWAKNNINYNNITFIEEDFDYKDMWIMSLCKNNIIANSTFSWWGSYLNKNKNKIVVAPSIWFGCKGPNNYKDIYEDNWRIINVTNNNGFLE